MSGNGFLGLGTALIALAVTYAIHNDLVVWPAKHGTMLAYRQCINSRLVSPEIVESFVARSCAGRTDDVLDEGVLKQVVAVFSAFGQATHVTAQLKIPYDAREAFITFVQIELRLRNMTGVVRAGILEGGQSAFISPNKAEDLWIYLENTDSINLESYDAGNGYLKFCGADISVNCIDSWRVSEVRGLTF